MSDQTKPPAKHLPHGNYERADWFEAECERLAARLEVSEAGSRAAISKAQWQARTNSELNTLVARSAQLEKVALWVKEHGSKHGMPDEVFAILATVGP
jgi:hypothetical protein